MTTEQRLLLIAGKLWPDLDVLDEPERKHIVRELVGIIYGTLLAVLGLGWLVLATDLALLGAEWPILLLMLILAAVLNQLDSNISCDLLERVALGLAVSKWLADPHGAIDELGLGSEQRGADPVACELAQG